MAKHELFYSEPVFRPPSEGKRSLLLTLTIGCAYNCNFCYPYRNKQFAIRKFEDVYQDIKTARKIYGTGITRIFLLDGNAFIAKPELLIKVAKACYENHPNLERITAYTHAKDILRKSDDDLKLIRKSGITMLYLGIETGSDELLKSINKSVTSEEIIAAAKKLYNAEITLSATFILGLAGNDSEQSRDHALKTADLINNINSSNSQDWYISALTLMTPPTTPIEHDVQTGKFTPITPLNALRELRTIIAHLSGNLQNCIFRSNHASNYLPIKGILANDKQRILSQIDQMIEWAKEYNVDGIIELRQLYSFPREFRFTYSIDRIKEAGIPHMFLRIDYHLAGIGMLRTRVEAFLEMIKEKNR